MTLIDMSDYNRPAKTYWIVMVIAGTAVFAWAAYDCFSFTQIQLAEFAGLL